MATKKQVRSARISSHLLTVFAIRHPMPVRIVAAETAGKDATIAALSESASRPFNSLPDLGLPPLMVIEKVAGYDGQAVLRYRSVAGSG